MQKVVQSTTVSANKQEESKEAQEQQFINLNSEKSATKAKSGKIIPINSMLLMETSPLGHQNQVSNF